ncbi:MAG: hypothetical protein ACOYBL_11160 [Lachnospiraceae bacterium]|jgi:hypothetical protein
MKKVLTRAGILFVVFAVNVLVMSIFLNIRQKTENKEDLTAAVQPLLAIDVGDSQINRMYGYTEKMQVDFMRDSLTPLDIDRTLTLSIDPYDHKIESVSYEVRTSDGKKVVENAKIKNFTTVKGEQKADFTLSGNLLMNQEYSLCLEVQTDVDTYYYYTRVISRTGLYVEAYVEFVESFYTLCLNKDSARSLHSYLETDSSRTNSSYTSVDIYSSWDQVTWGTLNPSLYRKGIPVIRDMNETTGSISVEYILTAKDEDGNTEYYQVTDFYRMRYTEARIRLLDFNRTATEIFYPESQVLTQEGVDLGIASKDISYVTNQNGDILSFVQAGDLWTYNISAGKLTNVFSFRDMDVNDERNDCMAHNMKIIRVGETGDVDFVLYGYMNRGEHEGSVGISVYHYSSDQNVLEEQIFLPSTLSYDFLKEDVERLSYVSTDDMLYLMIDTNLYQINLQKKTYEILKENIEEECFVVSNSHRHAAWMEGMDSNHTEQITIMDFETAKTRTITAEEGMKIRAEGFMNEDLVYGIARDTDIVVDGTGSLRFAMHRICIEDFDGNLVKDYQQDGIYVLDVIIEQGLMELVRAQWENNAYIQIASEHIMNNVKTEESVITVATKATERKGNQIQLNFSERIANLNPLQIRSKMLVLEEERVLSMEFPVSEEQEYYVYAKGRLDGIFDSPAAAIQEADMQMGVVLNRDQQYVWERGNKKDKISISLEDIPSAILAGTLDIEALQTELQDAGTVLDLSGCTLDQVLYQVSCMRPVIVKISDIETAVIVGYDPYNTILYYPATGETKYYGLNDSTALFSGMGNVFISYMESIE